MTSAKPNTDLFTLCFAPTSQRIPEVLVSDVVVVACACVGGRGGVGGAVYCAHQQLDVGMYVARQQEGAWNVKRETYK
jgi:hypothetical protein